MPNATDVIAYDTLLATCGGDAEILARIVAGLSARLPRDMAVLRKAIESQDLSQVREAAHKLHGMVAAFSTIAGDQTSDLEEHAERGDTSAIDPTFARLEVVLAALVRELEGVTIESLEAKIQAK